MASSLTICSFVMFFSLSSLFFPTARAVDLPISNQLSRGDGGGGGSRRGDKLLKIACRVDDVVPGIPWDYNLCIEVLNSYPNVASSPNLPKLVLNILDTGISNMSNTYTYINNTLKRGSSRPSVVNALNACGGSYKTAIGNFKSAFSEVKDDKEYETCSYDLMLARTDDIDSCNNALASNKVVDQAISSGNKFAFIFSVTADTVCSSLDKDEI